MVEDHLWEFDMKYVGHVSTPFQQSLDDTIPLDFEIAALQRIVLG